LSDSIHMFPSNYVWMEEKDAKPLTVNIIHLTQRPSIL
jgi:hypothetical protein